MRFTAPLKSNAIKIMLLGSGELGKEVAIEAQRLGLEVIAVDRYPNAPAMQVAHRSYVINMRRREELLEVIRRERPNYILPEVEAISIEALFDAENEGFEVIPNARAVSLTMNRRGIRQFAAQELGLPTSRFMFARTLGELREATDMIGYPCVIKPVMSSSGHGQSICRSANDVERSFAMAQEARGDASELIVEEFISFEYEITLLTVRNGQETIFCPPIGHIQQDGDYIYSWQPMQMSPKALERAKEIAKKVTDGLGGRGIFGVEMFVAGDQVWFSEVSPRPHDTGMVTLITQSQSEFALHLRAVLGLSVGFRFYTPGASAAFKAHHESVTPAIEIDSKVWSDNRFVRLFGKPESHVGRRMGVLLVAGESAEEALQEAQQMIVNLRD